MIRISIVAIIALLLQQYIQITEGVTCASNPCRLVAGLYDSINGYCCVDIGPYYTDALCICPNNLQVVNAPCYTGTNPIQGTCTKLCLNNGVCNIVNGLEVCYCQAGFSGANCEIQGVQNRCYTGLCQTGTCYEQTTGARTFAYCRCTPGFRGIPCNQFYFTCTRQGVFPDTAQCTLGRYFYCSQASGVPVSATCPTGQRFNRFTGRCDSAYRCT